MSQPPKGSKTSTKKHLTQVWKATGKKPEQLNQPSVFPEVVYLWNYFCEVHNGEPLTFTEIENWSKLTKKNISPQEALIVHQLSKIYFEIINGRRD